MGRTRKKGDGYLRKVINFIIWFLMIPIILYLFLSSLFGTCVMVYTNIYTYYLTDIMPGMLLLLVLLVFLLLRHREKVMHDDRTVRKIFLLITGIWLAALLVFIFSTQMPPTADQRHVYEGARELLAGNYNRWLPGHYFYEYPFQSGIVLLYCPFLLLFQNSAYLAIACFNVCCWFLTICILTDLTGHWFGKKSARLVYLLLLAFLPIWGYCTFVYGTVPGLFFAMAGIWFAEKYGRTGKRRNIVGCCICMPLAIMWKSNFEIFLVGVCIMLLLYAIRKKVLFPLLAVVLITVCCLTVIQGVPRLMTQITGQASDQGMPTVAWVAMGMQEASTAPGWYNGYGKTVYESNGNHPEIVEKIATENLKKSIRNFQTNKEYAVSFFGKKIASIWNDPAFEGFTIVNTRDYVKSLSPWMKDILYDGGVENALLLVFFDVLHSIVLGGVVLHLLLNRKKLNFETAVAEIIFTGGFIFHIFWEAKCQYTVPYYILLFPYAAAGYTSVVDRLANLRKAGVRSKKEMLAKISRTGSGKLAIALAVLILLTAILPGKLLSDTVKLGGQEKDYVWYCLHKTQWQSPDYVRYGDNE